MTNFVDAMPFVQISRRRQSERTAQFWDHVSDDLSGLRLALTLHIYGQTTVPSPTIVDVTPDYLGDANNAKVTFPGDTASVTRIRAETPRGGIIVSHLCYPSAAAINRLLVVFGGHSDHYLGLSADFVQDALQAGYHVLGIDMVINGNNATQNYETLGGTPVTVTSAHNYNTLVNDGVCGLRFFIDGAIGGINQALTILGLSHYDAVGISGGGWTIDFLSAIDTRCRRSYPVFASLPFDLRLLVGASATGDWEQSSDRSWWGPRALNGTYTNLYALGCLDAGRHRCQVLGTTDTAFTIANLLTQVTALEANVNRLVPAGNHQIRRDTTAAGHVYSPETVSFIIGDLNANP